MSGELAAVLFDMDGTLVDTESLWWQAAGETAAALGHELTDADVPEVLGQSVEHTAAHLAAVTGQRDVSAERLGADLQLRFSVLVSGRTEPLPGVLPLLGELEAARVPYALVSASPRPIVDLVLGVLGRHRFAATVAAGETPRTKPAPDPYLAATRALGVRPADCVAIEDTPTGVASAEAAGCRVLAVPSLLPIPAGRGRATARSLAEVDVALLRAIA